MYYLAKFIRKALLRLPLGFSLFLARAIGLFIYLNGRKRKVAFRNLKAAFPEKASREMHSILRKSFNHFGLTVIEQLIVSRIYENVIVREKEDKYPGGGIFVGIHAGNWGLAISYWANRHKFAVFVQQQKHKGLDKFLNELRQEEKIKVCFTLRELIKCIREDYMIGIVLKIKLMRQRYITPLLSMLIIML